MEEKSIREVLLDIIFAVKPDDDQYLNLPINSITNLIFGLLEDCQFILTNDEFNESVDRMNYIKDKLNAAVMDKNHDMFLEYLYKELDLLDELPDEKEVFEINYNICREHYENGNNIAIIGDSHVNFFSGNENLRFISIGRAINYAPQILLQYPFTCLHLGSCLAFNSCKKGTTNGFFEKMNYLMDEFLISGSKVVLSLGEIDLRCHVIKQCEKQKCSYEQIVNNILDNYFVEVDSIIKRGFKVYLWGPIASQREDCPIGEYYPRVGSEIERNKATLYFTREAEKRCADRNIVFMSIFEKMISPILETNDFYLSDDKCHLSQSALELAKAEWTRKKLI